MNAIGRYAITGYIFYKLAKDGEKYGDDYQSAINEAKSISRNAVRTPRGMVQPQTKLEEILSKLKNHTALDKVLSDKNINEYVNNTGSLFNIKSITEPNLLEIAKATFWVKHNQDETYMYFLLLGVVVVNSWKNKFCHSCGWRIIPARNPVNCIKCMFKNRVSTNNNKQQQKVFNKLKESYEYKSFLELRYRGKFYPALLACSLTPISSSPLECDHLDFTFDPEYRASKTALSKLWLQTEETLKIKKSQATIDSLLSLAKVGLSRANAANRLGLSRAAVTKACKAHKDLNDEFNKSRLLKLIKMENSADKL